MKIHSDWRRRLADWREETHSTGFELRRHFFSRFFDSDLVSTPGQWRVVAIGAFGIVISLSLVMTQAYYGKYRRLLDLDTPEPFQMAAIADHLFLIALSMFLIALLTALQWPSLFPGLRDYLALTSLPLRMSDVFVAKFSALFAFASVFIVGCNFLPSIILPGVMGGRYFTNAVLNIASIFISTTLAALFVFFALVALQGLLLNLLPTGIFPRVSLVAQGALLIAILCGMPFVFSIPNLQSHMNLRPGWVRNVPPFWFLGVDQAILGNREPFVLSLARSGWMATLAAALVAIGTYAWSYRQAQGPLTRNAWPVATGSSHAWPLVGRGWRVDRAGPQGARSLFIHRQDLVTKPVAPLGVDGFCRPGDCTDFRELCDAGARTGISRIRSEDIRPSSGRNFGSSRTVVVCAGGLSLPVPAARRTRRELGFSNQRKRQS